MFSSSQILDALAKGLEENEGSFTMYYDAERDWTVSIIFGREAEDSPMAGGAAFGLGSSAYDAMAEALTEAGWLK